LSEGRLGVADRENDRIQVFDTAGHLVDIWTDVQRPAAVAQSPSGPIVVAELNWKPGDFSFATGEVTEPRSARLSILDDTGRCIARIAGVPDVWRPHGLAIGPDGTIYLAQLGWPRGGDCVSTIVTARLRR
jgi:hypothetical protein